MLLIGGGKKAFKSKANDAGSPVDRDVYPCTLRFYIFENKIFAPAPELPGESTVNIFSHSCFLVDLLVFSQCVPAHYYLDPYIITAI